MDDVSDARLRRVNHSGSVARGCVIFTRAAAIAAMYRCRAICLNLTADFDYRRGGRFANWARMTTEHTTSIFIVADDQWVREIISSLLSAERFAVRVATNGQEALDLFQGGFRPNVLIVDLTDSKVRDVELLDYAHQDPELRSIPAILVTTERTERKHPIADEIFVKPIDVEQLIEAVQRLGVKA
jgi:CheY-like chemotaxis protein